MNRFHELDPFCWVWCAVRLMHPESMAGAAMPVGGVCGALIDRERVMCVMTCCPIVRRIGCEVKTQLSNRLMLKQHRNGLHIVGSGGTGLLRGACSR